jgi:recombination protein RecA
LLEKSGAWIAYGAERLGNGRDAARQYLLEHQEVLREIRGKLLARAGIGVAAAATEKAADENVALDERRAAKKVA